MACYGDSYLGSLYEVISYAGYRKKNSSPKLNIVAVSLQVLKYMFHNCVALVCERTIPTERPPHVDEISDNF
jgi:hypothetical protein